MGARTSAIFPFSTRNSLFGQIWSKKQKLRIVSLSVNLVRDELEYAKFNGGVHFFYFRLETPFFGKFGPKNLNCQFKLKFGT